MRILAVVLGATFASMVSPPARAQQAAIEATGQLSAEEADTRVTAETAESIELRPESGFQHSLRLGVSFPSGVSSEGRALTEDVSQRVPVMLDIGYRLSRHWYVGIMGMIGLDNAKDTCGLATGATNANCSIEGWRVGAELFVHPLGRDSIDLWLGGGIGWEHFEQKAVLPPTDPMGVFGSTLRSYEEGPALDLAAGVDFPIEGKLAAGPFLGYTGGMFTTRTSECPDTVTCPPNEIDETGLHHWLTLGARGTFGP